MSDVEAEIAELREDVSARQREQAQAAARHDQAQARVQVTTEALGEEFGVTDLEAAQVLAAQLEGELRADAAKIRAKLEQAGGLAG